MRYLPYFWVKRILAVKSPKDDKELVDKFIDQYFEGEAVFENEKNFKPVETLLYQAGFHPQDDLMPYFYDRLVTLWKWVHHESTKPEAEQNFQFDLYELFATSVEVWKLEQALKKTKKTEALFKKALNLQSTLLIQKGRLFDHLYSFFYDKMKIVFRRSMREVAIAKQWLDDCYQEAMLVLFDRVLPFSHDKIDAFTNFNLGGWIYGIVRNLLISTAKNEGRTLPLPEGYDIPNKDDNTGFSDFIIPFNEVLEIISRKTFGSLTILKQLLIEFQTKRLKKESILLAFLEYWELIGLKQGFYQWYVQEKAEIEKDTTEKKHIEKLRQQRSRELRKFKKFLEELDLYSFFNAYEEFLGDEDDRSEGNEPEDKS